MHHDNFNLPIRKSKRVVAYPYYLTSVILRAERLRPKKGWKCKENTPANLQRTCINAIAHQKRATPNIL